MNTKFEMKLEVVLIHIQIPRTGLLARQALSTQLRMYPMGLPPQPPWVSLLPPPVWRKDGNTSSEEVWGEREKEDYFVKAGWRSPTLSYDPKP
jgi:hypothetical protein